MDKIKWLRAGLALGLCLLLAACGSREGAVYVQNVGELAGSGAITAGDRFPGMVVAENVTEIQKDADKTVKELLVAAGDNVAEGQALFSYDTDALQLALDKQKLELEQLGTMISGYADQIEELEWQRKYAGQGDQLRYTVEIQSLQVQLREAELNQEAKQKEVEKSQQVLENATVYAPVAGRVQTVNEQGTDSYGNPAPYIVLQQEGSFRVEGSLNELQRGGLQEGTRMKILSRTEPGVFWLGTVALVDYDNPSQGSSSGGYVVMPGGGSDLTQSSNYPFYVVLESTEGLILGQHVYMEPDLGEAAQGVQVGGGFICYEENGDPYVWADKNGRLQKRPVTLGEYNMMNDTYIVTGGLSQEDYIAFPDEALCAEGAPTTRELPQEEPQQSSGGGDMVTPMPAPAVGMDVVAEGGVA